MEVQCKFGTHKGKFLWFNNPYTCRVTKYSKSSLEKEIKSFNGTHEKGKSNDDVEWLDIIDQPIGFVPGNLNKVFPKLTHLTTKGCGLENISREDLKGLEGIEYIDFRRNKLTSLPDDLFADMKKLRWIYFDDNQLKRLSSKLLLPIERTLEVASFKGNKRINEKFDTKSEGRSDLTKFMKAIDFNCLPAGSQADRMLDVLSKFKISGEFTDFTIKVREKEFKIHKNIFAAQSSVFRKMFTDETDDVTKSFNKIKNFSEVTFEQFLDYFYSWKLDAESNATQMFELASEFDVPELKTICTTRILANLDESNAVEVFNLAHRHASDVLKRNSFKVIKEMFPELDATFENKLDEVNDLVALKAEMDAIMKKK